MTINEFIHTFHELDYKGQLDLYINGQWREKKAFMDFQNNLSQRVEMSVSVDIDSVLGTCAEIPVLDDFKIYPFPSRDATINKNNYMRWEGRLLVTIPNLHFADTGVNAMFKVHIFFPNLETTMVKGRWRNFMRRDEYQTFYDYVVRVAILDVLPSSVHHNYPISYVIEEFNSRIYSGEFRSTGRNIIAKHVPKLLTRMREIVEENDLLEEYRGFFYHIHTKGQKMILKNTMGDPLELLNREYRSFDWDVLNLNGELHLDIGIEILPNAKSGSDKYTLLWSQKFCSEYLRSLGMIKIQEQPWSFTNDIGGSTGEQGTSAIRSVRYIQMYMTEKNPLYTFKKGGVRNLTPQDVMTSSSRYLETVNHIRECWHLCENQNFGVRLEWRCQYDSARDTLNTIDREVLNFIEHNHQAFYTFKSKELFEFRNIGLKVVEMMNSSLTRLKPDPSAVLAIKAFLWYLIKGFISSPDPRFARKLLNFMNLKEGMRSQNLPCVQHLDTSTMRFDDFLNSDILEEIEYRKKFRSSSYPKKYKPLADDHADDIQGPTQVLLDDISGFTVEDIFQLFLISMWNSIPALSRHVLQGTEIPEPAPTLTELNVRRFLRGFAFRTRSRFTWKERFNWYFPSSPLDIPTGQGWKTMTYLDQYLTWLPGNQDKRNDLYSLFGKLDVLPAGTRSTKLWITQKSSTRSEMKTLIVFTKRASNDNE